MSHCSLLANLGALIAPSTLVCPPDIWDDVESAMDTRDSAQILLAAQTAFICKAAESVVATAQPEERGRMKIGFIGCGVLGKHVLNSLILNGFPPENICVSSRRPKTLARFSSLGVTVAYDNVKVARSCRVVLLLCLPTHLNRVAGELKRLLRRRCILISFLLGVTEEKVAAMFQCPALVIRPCARLGDLTADGIAQTLQSLVMRGACDPAVAADLTSDGKLMPPTDLTSTVPEPALFEFTPPQIVLAAQHLCPDVDSLKRLYSIYFSLAVRVGLKKEAAEILVNNVLLGIRIPSTTEAMSILTASPTHARTYSGTMATTASPAAGADSSSDSEDDGDAIRIPSNHSREPSSSKAVAVAAQSFLLPPAPDATNGSGEGLESKADDTLSAQGNALELSSCLGEDGLNPEALVFFWKTFRKCFT